MLVKDKEVVINPKYTYSKSEYARKYAVSRVTVDKLIREGDLKTVQVNGVTLITLK
jgi:hypothetical protein